MKPVLVLLLVGNVCLCSFAAFSQTPTLEFTAGAGNPTTQGPVSSQSITVQNNTDNPTGNTFAAFGTPLTTATFTPGNFQYVLTPQAPTTNPLMIGGSNSSTAVAASANIFDLMNAVGAAVDADFTSAPTVTAGTGINQTVNQAVWMYTSVMGMYNAGQSTTGRYYIGDLTISFNQLVTNPVLQLVGMGATDGAVAMSTELELQTPSLTLSVLSGSPELTISGGTKILNGAATPGSATGSGAMSGSVLVTGTNITSMTFQVYLRAVGGTGSVWTTGPHVGDVWMIGVSFPTSQVVALALPITNFTAVPQGATAQLKWSTETEENSRFFEIEANRSGKGWQSVGMVMAAGNSSALQQYSFTDVGAVAGNNAYRIKAVDADGSAIYSGVVTLGFGGNSQAKFFPNPVKDRLYIMSNGEIIQSVVVSDTEGKEVYQTGSLSSGNSLDMSHLAAGIYFVTIRYVSGQSETVKVIKN